MTRIKHLLKRKPGLRWSSDPISVPESSGFPVELETLRRRVEILEQQVGKISENRSKWGTCPTEDIEPTLQDRFSQKVVSGLPNMSYFNIRFRDYEHLTNNIKTLGYALAHQTSEVARRAAPQAPVDQVISSKLCTQADMESPWLNFWCKEFGIQANYHRKNWEFCYIAQALYMSRKFTEDMQGIGFGCGDEPLPSLFAKYGAKVIATDLEADKMISAGWGDSTSRRGLLANILHPRICPDPKKLAQIQTANVDMNSISRDLAERFDFCWSSCALEHLGSIEKGLQFIINSLSVLKPGGVAVHTTEYSLDQDGELIDNWPTVLFRQMHMVELAKRLESLGHVLAPLDFSVGDGVLDGYVDIPPYQNQKFSTHRSVPHLRLSIDGFACTSLGLIIQKAT